MSSYESIKIEHNVPAKMRDGTNLYADIWRPDTKDRYPAIITRLPYNKNVLFPIAAGYLNPQRYARAGYAVALQDVRGTGASDGEPHFWWQEVDDGYDTVEWTAEQSWCDGNVGMFGYSYFGYTQWAAAVSRPPHLKAICPGFTEHIPRSFPFTNRWDAFKLGIHLRWALMISYLALLRGKLPPEELKLIRQNIISLTDTIQDQYMVLPLKGSPAAKQTEELGVFPFYSDILVNMEDDDYWHRIGSLLQLDKVEIPALHIAGWYDPDMTPGVLASYQELKEKGGSELSRTKQRLLIGPWIHSADMSNMVGDLDFGMASSGAVADITGVQIRWFDYWLKGIDNGMANESPVRIFVMGENVWRDEDEWPLARTKYIKYYFHSGGRANSLLGDGILNSDAPDNEQSDSYLYDPRNPAPSDKMMGAWDQQEVEKRADVLVYSSLPLETDLEVTGSVEVNIYAESSAIDTDFTGKLIDVWPDGKAYNVAVGIVRARFRQSVLKPDPIKPGVVYEYNISLSATSNVFKAGHRIRIEISSSYFPKWDRNLNTGHPIGQDDEIERAIQTIHHSKQYPSNIVLPMIPR